MRYVKKAMRVNTKQKGFTLIEVMVVAVIVAILAAIAIPSYQNHIQKTRRSDATSTLTQLAAAQERHFFSNNGYLLGTDFVTRHGTESADGFYTIGISAANCTSCYTLTATARGPQLNDTRCRVFSLNYVGERSAKDADGNASTDQCW